MAPLFRSPDHYYNEDIDFNKLAEEDELFGTLYHGSNGHLKWQDPVTVQALTKALLKRDFNLELCLPDDRLCPPVPVRWNYIRWLQDIIDTTGQDYSDTYHPEQTVTGLDIGTGASCIYALLACASRPQWRMLGTDIDSHSLEYAKKNVAENGLDYRIKLKRTRTEDALMPLEAAAIETVDFVLCNPPFYDSEEDMNEAYRQKALPPSAVCTGSASEMICPGGDIGFAQRILEESLNLKERVRWYSCMFSRLASAQQLVTLLKKHGISNFAATNLKAGQKTVRWAIAWSFTSYRPRNDVARHGSLIMALLPPATERTIEVRSTSARALGSQLDDILSKLDLTWDYRSIETSGLVITSANVWSRSAKRRKRLQSSSKVEKNDDDEEEQHVAMAVRITCSDSKLDVRWLRGNNGVVLESFVGMLRTELGVHKHM